MKKWPPEKEVTSVDPARFELRLLFKRQNIAAEKEQFDLEVKRGKFELKTVVREQVLTHINTLFRELDKAFKHELPPRVEGLSAGDIAKLCGRRLDGLRERLVKNFEGATATELA